MGREAGAEAGQAEPGWRRTLCLSVLLLGDLVELRSQSPVQRGNLGKRQVTHVSERAKQMNKKLKFSYLKHPEASASLELSEWEMSQHYGRNHPARPVGTELLPT